MLLEGRARSVRRYKTMCSPAIGLCAGGFVLAIFAKTAALLPPPSAPSAPLAVEAWVHGTIGLTSFAGGFAVALDLAYKGVPLPRFCRYYSIAVASGWCVVTSSILWRLAVLVWPLFAADLLLVVVAGLIGVRLTPVDTPASTSAGQPA